MNIEPKGIKNIIFDLGNVLLNVNFDATIQEMKNLGIYNIEAIYTRARQTTLFDDFEKGLILESDFLEALQQLTTNNFSNEQLRLSWNKMLGDIPNQRMDMLLRLKKKYNLYLLSNTNIMHYKIYSESIKNKFGIGLADIMNKEYYSFDLKMRKPDLEIFHHVLIDSNIRPSETLFIDDNIDNILTAEKIGINTYHINDTEEVAELLKFF